MFENLELAQKSPRGILRTLAAVLPGPQRDEIAETIRVIGLAGRERVAAGALSHGQKQWLEIGMLLIQDQRLLLLDEPVAGMTDRETEATAELILSLAGSAHRHRRRARHGVRAQPRARVTVLHEGSVLAEGSIDFVQNEPAVIEVYLGR